MTGNKRILIKEVPQLCKYDLKAIEGHDTYMLIQMNFYLNSNVKAFYVTIVTAIYK